jgi:hypothetical protein
VSKQVQAMGRGAGTRPAPKSTGRCGRSRRCSVRCSAASGAAMECGERSIKAGLLLELGMAGLGGVGCTAVAVTGVQLELPSCQLMPPRPQTPARGAQHCIAMAVSKSGQLHGYSSAESNAAAREAVPSSAGCISTPAKTRAPGRFAKQTSVPSPARWDDAPTSKPQRLLLPPCPEHIRCWTALEVMEAVGDAPDGAADVAGGSRVRHRDDGAIDQG